jgi:glycosyltransferase involved in cell wall biosynthesis
VDAAHFRPQARPAAAATQPFTVGYAGGLVPEKGVDLLIAACAGLPGDWRLLLAGEGEAQASLAAQAQALGMGERVVFTGRHASDAMPAFYNQLDVLALPSRTLPNWKEQFGRVLIEAMACEAPVVGSDSGEIPQVIGEAGLVFPEGDGTALGAALARLAGDSGLRQRLGAAGRARVLEHYTMGSVAERTVALYRDLSAQPTPHPAAAPDQATR